MSAWKDRHPSVQHFEKLFDYDHLPENLADISAHFAVLADALVGDVNVKDGPELSACLRKLLEAKDCAVRSVL